MEQQEIEVQIAADDTALFGPDAEIRGDRILFGPDSLSAEGRLFASYEGFATLVCDALHAEYPGVYVWVEVRGIQNKTRLYGFPLEDENRIKEQINDIIHEVWETFDWVAD